MTQLQDRKWPLKISFPYAIKWLSKQTDAPSLKVLFTANSIKINTVKPGVMPYTFNPYSGEKAEERGFQWVPGQQGLHSEILSQNKQTKTKNKGLTSERSMGNSRAAEWLKAPLSVVFKWCFSEAGSSGARRTEVGSEDLRASLRLFKREC